MTTLIFNSTQLKATLLGSLWARGGRPDPAKLPKGNFDLHRVEKQGEKMRKKKEEDILEKVTIRLPKSKKETIINIVEKGDYNSISELVRAGIDKELNTQIYKDNLDFIIKELDVMIDAKLKPLIQSQRKMSAKHLRTSAINTYLAGEVLNRLLRR